MKSEINLLKNYPTTNRNLEVASKERDEQARKIARRFDKDFFDGERRYGYGGFNYNEKYWYQVVRDIRQYYDLAENAKILDVGCAKGFMIYEFHKLNKKFFLRGIDISEYAINNSKEEIKSFCKVGNAMNLPFENDEFDLVISINTIHNLSLENCKKALLEIERVSKKNKFITVDAFSNEEEKKKMFSWNLTAKTILSKNEWINIFNEVNYTGDYYWFIP